MNQSKRRQHNAMHGALILIIATAMVKFIGAIFKIPLGRLIGGTGMGYYMTAYELYAPIYTLAMAGLPIAISKVVAAAVSEQRQRDVRVTLKAAKNAFIVTGFIGFMIMLLAAYPFSLYISKDINSLYSIMIISPSMLFCCIMACYRGYYEGLRNMYPTAISQVIEALGKLVFGYGLAYLIINKGMSEFGQYGTVFGNAVTNRSAAFDLVLPYAAAGAIGGVTIGTFIGAVYMIIRHRTVGDGIMPSELAMSPPAMDYSKSLKMLLAFALPVVLGALAQNVSGLIDVITVQHQLSFAVESSVDVVKLSQGGAIESIAPDKIPNFLFGCYKGFAYSFYNLIPTVTSVIGISTLPNLTTAWYTKNIEQIKINIQSVLRMTAIIAVPVGFGLSALAKPILQMFFSHQPAEVAVSTNLLKWLAIAGVAAGIAMPITSMLQAIDKQFVPVRNLIFGILVKFALNIVLVKIPGININGAAYSTLACYVVVLVLNIVGLIRHSKIKLNIWSALVKPIIAGILCSVAALTTFGLLEGNFSTISKSVLVAAAIAIGGIIYVIVLFCLKTLTENDIKLLPKGEKIAKVLAKLKLIG